MTTHCKDTLGACLLPAFYPHCCGTGSCLMLEQLHSAEQCQCWHPHGLFCKQGSGEHSTKHRHCLAQQRGAGEARTNTKLRRRERLCYVLETCSRLATLGQRGLGACWKCRRMKEEEDSQPCKERDPEPARLWEPVNLGCFARGRIMGRQRLQG